MSVLGACVWECLRQQRIRRNDRRRHSRWGVHPLRDFSAEGSLFLIRTRDQFSIFQRIRIMAIELSSSFQRIRIMDIEVVTSSTKTCRKRRALMLSRREFRSCIRTHRRWVLPDSRFGKRNFGRYVSRISLILFDGLPCHAMPWSC